MNPDKDNCLVAMYGKTQYTKAMYDFHGCSDKVEFCYPGLALFKHLQQNQKKSFRNILIIGSDSSYWFDMVLNFKHLFAMNGIPFPFADRIAGCSSEDYATMHNAESPEKIFDATAKCEPDEIKLIQNEINEILKKHYKCSLTILIYNGDISSYSVQTDIIEKILECKEMFLNRYIYLDVTNGFRFIPLLVLASLKFLQNIQNLRIADIFYAQNQGSKSSFISLGMLNRIYDESVCYSLFSDSVRLHHIAGICTDTNISSGLLEIDKRLNLQEFDKPRTVFGNILPKLNSFFGDSTVFTPEFFEEITKSLSSDMYLLLRRYIDNEQMFSAILLLEYIRLSGIHDPFADSDKKRDKYLKFRNRILHYEYADREDNSIVDYGSNLKSFLYSNEIISGKDTSGEPDQAPLPVFFTFIGSARYDELEFDIKELEISKSRFIANSLSMEYFKKGEISKYVVIGTYTSGWKGFVDFLLEQYNNSLDAIDVLAEIEQCFKEYAYMKNERNGMQEDYRLNEDAVTRINSLFERHKKTLGQYIEIFGYDDIYSNQNSYEELRTFLTSSIAPGQDFIVDITHSFRSIPIVAFLTLFSVTALKGSKLKHLWYSLPHGKNCGKLLDLTYLANMISDSMSVGLFSGSEDPGYLLPLLNRYLPEQSELYKCISEGSKAEKMLYFSTAQKSYKQALEIISSIDLSSKDKLLNMIFPFFEKNLQNVKSELFSKAVSFCKKGRYSMAICALYEAYNSFAEKLNKNSEIKKVDWMDASLYDYTDLVDSMVKDECEYISELPEKHRSGKKRKMDAKMRKYGEIVENSSRMIHINSNFDLIKRLRRYITSEIKESCSAKFGGFDFNEARKDIFFDKEQKKKFFSAAGLNIPVLEKTIKESADELKQLYKFKDEFFELVARKSAEQQSDSEQTSTDECLCNENEPNNSDAVSSEDSE